MKPTNTLTIAQLDNTEGRKHYSIDSLIGLTEEQLRAFPEVAALEEGGYTTFEKSNSPEFPLTWYAHVLLPIDTTTID